MPAPNLDTERRYCGFSTLAGGIDFGSDSSLLADNEAAFASNLSFRGDLPKTRPPLVSIPLDQTITGLFQGAAWYETADLSALILSVAGRQWKVEVTPSGLGNVTEITPQLSIVTTTTFVVPAPAATVIVGVSTEEAFAVGDTVKIDSGTYTVTNRFADALQLTYVGGAAHATVASGAAVQNAAGQQIIFSERLPDNFDFVHLFQAERYMIGLAEQQAPRIFDGSLSRLAGPTEIPSGFLGLYAWGRIWVALSDRRTFVAGDIVYGPSGTASQGFVDAILKFTENDFLNEGGFFSVPNNAGLITSMMALATIDTSLGIGPILIGTTGSVISVNAPVDRTTWKNLTYPIQTVSLIDFGPLGPRSTISVNNDMWYRASDGLRSFIIARRGMGQWGNTPISFELSPVFSADTRNLLFYGSAILFDNRVFCTVAPRRDPAGIVHSGLAVINFDSLSTIGNKQPPIWEGIYSGLDILQIVRGRINDEERAFVVALGPEGNIELWELLPEGKGFYDTYKQVSGIDTTLVRTPIPTVLETKRYVFDRLVKLIMAELYLDDIVDEVVLTVKFRPDQYPSWVTWATVRLCATVTQCTMASQEKFSCTIWKPNARTYAARLRLPRPPESCNMIAGIPLDRGYEFAFRLEGTGHFRLRKFRPHSRLLSDATEGECPPSQAVCQTFPDCGTEWFSYSIARS
jgi:hypothetical protein